MEGGVGKCVGVWRSVRGSKGRCRGVERDLGKCV